MGHGQGSDSVNDANSVCLSQLDVLLDQTICMQTPCTTSHQAHNIVQAVTGRCRRTQARRFFVGSISCWQSVLRLRCWHRHSCAPAPFKVVDSTLLRQLGVQQTQDGFASFFLLHTTAAHELYYVSSSSSSASACRCLDAPQAGPHAAPYLIRPRTWPEYMGSSTWACCVTASSTRCCFIQQRLGGSLPLSLATRRRTTLAVQQIAIQHCHTHLIRLPSDRSSLPLHPQYSQASQAPAPHNNQLLHQPMPHLLSLLNPPLTHTPTPQRGLSWPGSHGYPGSHACTQAQMPCAYLQAATPRATPHHAGSNAPHCCTRRQAATPCADGITPLHTHVH